MRKLKLGFAVVMAATVLAGCGSPKSGALAPLKVTPAQVEAHIEKLSAEAFKLQAKGGADIASVRDALPKAVSLTWGGLDFDAASGATVLKEVKLTPADMPNVGLKISELRLWDFNAAFARARLSGQQLAESGDLARRIEAIGTSVFGLETLMGPAANAYTGALADAVTAQAPPEVAAEVSASMQTRLDNYEFSIGHLVFDDVKLRPYVLKLAQLPPENQFAEVMPLLQTYAAAARSFASDTFFLHQLRGQMAMTQGSEKMSMAFTADTYGARGIRGSDIDAAFMRGIAFDMAVPVPEAAGTPPMSMKGGVDYISMEGMKLDKVAGYLARGEWPARTDTDLMGYGLFMAKNERFSLNGHDVYSVGEAVLDARKWHWFVPAKVSIKANDITYDIKALMEFAAEMGATGTSSAVMPEVDPANPAQTSLAAPASPAPLIDPSIMQMLTKYGLDKPSMDFALGWDWNPASGATVVDAGFGLDNYLRFNMKYDGGMPNFKGVSDLIPGSFETAKGEEISALFSKESKLKAFEFNVVDEGGLGKIFALTAEVGKSLPPDQTGGVAVFANATPESLRSMASAAVYMAADQAATMAPGMKEIIAPFGAFLDKGGRVRFTLKPKAPLAFSSIMAREDVRNGTTNPLQLIVENNGKTVHTPATPAK